MMKKRLRLLCLLLVALAVDGLLLKWWIESRRERRFDPHILEASKRYGVPPGLIKAVMWQESRFQSSAVGGAGEIGLMQIRDVAAQEWAEAEKVYPLPSEHLFNPRTNTLAGSFYLAKVLKRYRTCDNPIPYGLADYNAGRANVLRWNKGEAKTNSAAFLAQMDFPGTKRYIALISGKFAHYQKKFPKSDEFSAVARP